MTQQREVPGRKPAASTTPVEIEPSDEFQPAYGRGGPVRSDEPERDFFFEDRADSADDPPVSPPSDHAKDSKSSRTRS